MRLLLDKAIGASGSTRPIDSVFSRAAMTTLVALRYSLPTVRALMSICREALAEADNHGRDTITEGDVAYGATQVLDTA